LHIEHSIGCLQDFKVIIPAPGQPGAGHFHVSDDYAI